MRSEAPRPRAGRGDRPINRPSSIRAGASSSGARAYLVVRAPPPPWRRRGVVVLRNLSGYDTGDLLTLLDRGFRAEGVRRPIHVTVKPSPVRSRGCATVGRVVCNSERCTVVGERQMVLVLASPSHGPSAGFRRRLSRLVRHEVRHVLGDEHRDMDEKTLYSLGPTLPWARGARLRWVGRPVRHERRIRVP